jgi:two-component system sensor histidine kinase UhpB
LSAAIEVDIRGDFDDVGDTVSVVMYRVVQEALTNVARHAAAARVRLSIHRESPDRQVHIHISDDGRGADLTARNPGLGLIGMRERVAALGGSVTLTSTAQRGFELRALIPVAGA